ncbi:MAG: DUF1214 domain-containing protein [Pseudomonadota bacterium]
MTVLGVAAGGVSALFLSGLLPVGPRLGGAITIDGWTSDWSIGSQAANPYVRARIARHGLLAMRKEEAVYFTRNQDDQGRRLTEDCTYSVSGGALPAEWWSITLYDSESRLPMNEDNQLSFDKTDAEQSFSASSDWTFEVRVQDPADLSQPWVSNRAAGAFDLMLRLYRPSAGMLKSPTTVLEPPSITRVSCDGEVP